MARPTLERGAKGQAVAELQDLMNRTGQLLALDGDYGPGTERAVNRCHALRGAPQTGIADAGLWEFVEALPEPSDALSCEAVTFIVREEVGSRAYYDSHTSRPHDPGEASGVTIGIGFDLRFQGDRLDEDWGPRLPADQIERLRACVGVKGNPTLVADVHDIVIPFESAWQVFLAQSLPRFVKMTRDTFPGYDALPDLCRGVLVSLVYNRGTSMAADKESRREMREIRDAVGNGNPGAVPALVRSMTRLWSPTSGLVKRREREAVLWEAGMNRG